MSEQMSKTAWSIRAAKEFVVAAKKCVGVAAPDYVAELLSDAIERLDEAT